MFSDAEEGKGGCEGDRGRVTSLTVRGRVVVAGDGMRGSFVSFVDCCVKRRTDRVY